MAGSKYSNQQYRYQSFLVSRARDLYSCARSFKLTHEQILKRRQEKLFDTPAWKHANGYVKAYVGGVLDQLRTDHYRELAWGFKVDGLIMTVDEMRARWPKDWYTRCEQSTESDPGNGTHFYPDANPQKRSPF